MRKAWEDLNQNSEDTFNVLGEIFSHIPLIKIFAKEIATRREYLKKLIFEIRIRLKNIKLEMLSGFISRSEYKIVVGLISLYGGYQVIKGNLSLGSLSAITLYMYQLISLPNEFYSIFETFTFDMISCKKIAKVLDEKITAGEIKNAKKVIFEKGDIIFENVNFGYLQNQYVLRNVNFRISSGCHIALVGHSGCGKTTILNLLARLYEPWTGEVFIDNWNINAIKLHSLRKQIGFALQEPFLLNSTIEDNIKYAREDATSEELMRVSKITCVDEFIKDLPNGYQTVVGENASKISEGQKQRIAIARAIIKNPKILILDEALSSLDSQTEEKIIDNLRSEFWNSTLIIVSHRFSTVQKMNLVYFFESPSNMRIGTHEELIEISPAYRRLFASQV